MPKQPSNWPVGVLPRGLDCAQAAYYVGLSPTTFLERVRLGVYPLPREEGRRSIWDRKTLDATLDRMAGIGAKMDVGATAAEEAAIAAFQGRRRG